MTKIIYVIIDGVGDRPHPDLNGLTPTEAALTPNLDSLSSDGVMGLVTPVDDDFPPESDSAVFSMLGYDVTKSYAGRGVVEAIGSDLDFRNGDLALRGNFATINDDLEIIDRRAGRNLTHKEAVDLSSSINSELHLTENATFTLLPTIGHRVTLIIKHPTISLTSNISNTDPAYERVGSISIARENVDHMNINESKQLDDVPTSKKSSNLINEFTAKAIDILKDHPINIIREKEGNLPANSLLFRDAGSSLPSELPLSKRFNKTFACLADMPVELGIAKITGMHPVKSNSVNDYLHKAKQTVELLKKFDVVYVHLKGPDEPGHDGDAKLKKEIIENIDSLFFKFLLDNLNFNDVIYAVTGDHSTPCILKAHSSDPVPLLISFSNLVSSSQPKDSSIRFTEKNGFIGSLGKLKGIEVLPKILSYS